MGRPDEARRGQAHPATAGGDLQAVGAQPGDHPAPAQHPRQGHRPRAHRRAHRAAGQSADTAQPSVGEGADADPVEGVHPAQQLDQRRHHGVLLGVDVDPNLGPGLEDLLQAGDPDAAAAPGVGAHAVGAEAVPGVGGLDLRRGHRRDPAGPVGDPVEDVVVKGEDHAVGTEVDVGLHVAVAQLHRGGEGGQGVLRLVEGAAAMGEGDRAGPAQEGAPAHYPTSWPRRPSQTSAASACPGASDRPVGRAAPGPGSPRR